MNQDAANMRIDRHHAFWERKPLQRPRVSFPLHDYFISKRMHEAKDRLVDKK
jgi:hypothetical protein